MNNCITDIVIIGSSGFIGKHLVNKLCREQDFQLRLLQHQTPTSYESCGAKLKIIKGDLFNISSLQELITESSIVINLVYLANSTPEKNLEAISNITKVCIEKKARRLIHCSTAVVCGRAPNNFITEDVIKRPFDKYEILKLNIETELAEKIKGSNLELTIIRPTCVFGENGKNLLMLINDLTFRSKILNYIKSCLYNKRTMNLVSVFNVVSAIDFLIKHQSSLNNQIFIISDDDNSDNNFQEIEKKIINVLGLKDYCFPRINCPLPLLSMILWLAQKSNINPIRRFKSDKLKNLGWVPEHTLTKEIDIFLKSISSKNSK